MPRVPENWLGSAPESSSTDDLQPASPAQKNDLALDANGDVTTESVTVTPNSNVRRLAQIVGAGEGDYESYNTGTNGVPGERVGHSYLHPPAGTVTGRTINQVFASASLPGTDPNRMFAVGAYQITIPTLKKAVSALGLTGDEQLTPELQDRIFKDYLLPTAGDGALGNFLNGGRATVDQAQLAAARQWASIAVPRGYRTKSGSVSDGTASYYPEPANRANLHQTQALRAFLGDLARWNQ